MDAELKRDGSVELSIVRDLAFPTERASEAWLQPDQLVQRMGPTKEIAISNVQIDAVANDRYHMQFNDTDGTVHKLDGVYRIIPPNRYRCCLTVSSVTAAALFPQALRT